MLLITTSRRTSNRVRSFTRDLWSVLPGSERITRGGMSVDELVARINSSESSAAFVVTIERGNPSSILVLDPHGKEIMTIYMGSAVLRREVSSTKVSRIKGIHSISIPPQSGVQTMEIAGLLSEITAVPITKSESIRPINNNESGLVVIRIEDSSGSSSIWSHYHASDVREIGPRILIRNVESI